MWSQTLERSDTMNAAHLHLILNHVPVLGVPFCLVLLVIGIVQKNGQLMRLAHVLAVGVALVTIPVFLTGEPAEEIVEHLPGVAERLIEAHESAAETAMILTLVSGVLSLCKLLSFEFLKPAQRWVTLLVVLTLAASAGLLGYAANLGGQIRHTELRGEAVESSAQSE
jgi:hypothetical protein